MVPKLKVILTLSLITLVVCDDRDPPGNDLTKLAQSTPQKLIDSPAPMKFSDPAPFTDNGGTPFVPEKPLFANKRPGVEEVVASSTSIPNGSVQDQNLPQTSYPPQQVNIPPTSYQNADNYYPLQPQQSNPCVPQVPLPLLLQQLAGYPFSNFQQMPAMQPMGNPFSQLYPSAYFQPSPFQGSGFPQFQQQEPYGADAYYGGNQPQLQQMDPINYLLNAMNSMIPYPFLINPMEMANRMMSDMKPTGVQYDDSGPMKTKIETFETDPSKTNGKGYGIIQTSTYSNSWPPTNNDPSRMSVVTSPSSTKNLQTPNLMNLMRPFTNMLYNF